MIEDHCDWQNLHLKLSYYSCFTKIQTDSVVGSVLKNKQRKVDLEVLESRTRAQKQPLFKKVEVSEEKDIQPFVEMAGTEVGQQ